MKYFLILLLTILCVPAIAQRLKLPDLEYILKTNDISKTQDYLLNKGLTFDKKIELDKEKPVTYVLSFSNLNNNDINVLYVDVNQIENQVYSATITTKLFNEFVLFKKFAESVGFKLTDTDFEENISFTDLELKNLRLTMIVGNKDGGKLYQMCLTNINLEKYLRGLKKKD